MRAMLRRRNDPERNRHVTVFARRSKRLKITRILIRAALILAAVALAGTAESKGCLKGAVVGGIAGHMAGHGVVGAAAGCAIGRHEANKKDKTIRQGDRDGSAR